jgi:RNA polymerase sigma factor (sigma-70 family)
LPLGKISVKIDVKTDTMDEQELIKDARNGDLDAFNRLVLEYQDRIYGQAYRVLGDGAAAADAAQDAFILAFKHLSSYKGGSFRAWLFRIVTNVCYDELRRRQRRPTTPLEPLDGEDEEIESPRWMIDPGESPEEASERLELSHSIQKCLNNLTPEFRSTLVMVDVQGMDYHEVANALGCAVGTIKSRVARARLSVRGCLQGVAELLPSVFRLGGEGIL